MREFCLRTLSTPLGLITITELDGLVLAYDLSVTLILLNLVDGIHGNEPVEAPEGTMAR